MTTANNNNCAVQHNKVLLADDDPALVRLLATWLELSGFEVRHAVDGQQALQAIEEDCPDFLITDWEMPNMDGRELCRRLRGMTLPHYVYIIFLSKYHENDDVIDGLQSGADDFLAKPVTRSELLARMNSGSRVLELERRLSFMAKSDVLTGLDTRRTFCDHLEMEWKRADRYQLPLSCVMFDIDFFKRVNDLHGHAVGDKCLRRVAQLLTTSCRRSDIACRYAGDEFLALLPETDEEGAALWAERLRRQIRETTIKVGETKLQITASFGVAQQYKNTRTPDQLIEQADHTLLFAKKSGRDCVLTHASIRRQSDANEAPESAAEAAFGSATAEDVMTRSIVTLSANDPVRRTLELLMKYQFTFASIVDNDGKLIGILTEKDLNEILLSPEAWDRPVGELMTRNVISYTNDSPAKAVYEFLSRVRISRVVVTRDETPIGFISRGSLLRWRTRTLDGSAGPAGDDQPGQNRSEQLKPLAKALSDETQHLMQQLDNAELTIDEPLAQITACIAEVANEMVQALETHSPSSPVQKS